MQPILLSLTVTEISYILDINIYMGTALFTVNLNFKCVNSTGMSERFMELISRNYIRPQSIFMYAPGTRLAFKMDNSIDNPFELGSNKSSDLYDVEYKHGETVYTKIYHNENHITFPRDYSLLVANIEKIRHALKKQKKGGNQASEICVKFWGDTKVFYAGKQGEIQSEWMFREWNAYLNRYVPLVEITVSEGGGADSEYDIRIVTSSRIWSKYSSEYNDKNASWIEKNGTASERYNSIYVADVLCEYLKEYGDAKLSWEYDQSHSPRLGELLVEELEKRFGTVMALRIICQMPYLKSK